MKIILTGGTGFIGKSLAEEFMRRKATLIVLTRKPKPESIIEEVLWDGKSQGLWSQTLSGADAVINLAGEPIAEKRWTPEQKKKILESRIQATRAVVEAIRAAKIKPSVLINASAIGFYGGHGEAGEIKNEYSAKGAGFLADTCDQWEREALEAAKLGVRVVLVRIGIVLERGGGALGKMLAPFQYYVGGPLGSGKQPFPWVHRDDVIGAILFALDHPEINGPLNAVAPETVTMKEFCTTLGKVLNRPSWAPVPAFILRLMLGEMAEMLLTGERIEPAKLLKADYPFRHPQLEEALTSILK